MSYAKMMGTMRRNPHCFGTPGHGAKDPNHKHKVKINLENPDPLPDWEPPAEPKPKSYPGRGTRVPTVLRPGTGPYNPRGNQFPGGGRRKENKKDVLINRPRPVPRRPGSFGYGDGTLQGCVSDLLDNGGASSVPEAYNICSTVLSAPPPNAPQGRGSGTRVPTVLRPGTGPYNPNQRRSRRGGRRGLSPMQRRNEQGLRKVKAR